MIIWIDFTEYSRVE